MDRQVIAWRSVPPCVLWLAGCVAACSSGDGKTQRSVDKVAIDWSLEELSSEQGISIHIPSFEIPPGRESQNCFFLKVPDVAEGEDVWIDQIKVGMNPGSHHMNIFRVKTELGLRADEGEPIKLGPYDATVQRGSDEYATHPCWNSSNWADWPLVANTQESYSEDPYTDWKLPEGVATRLSPGEMLMIQTHYVNTDVQPTPGNKGEVAINLYRTKTKKPMELGTLFATQQNIRICKSNGQPTYSGTCRFPNGVTVTAVNGHFHSRGARFDVFRWDGRSTSHPGDDQRFYRSKAWDHPDMSRGLDVDVAEGGGVWWDCAYKWTQPSVYTCDDVDAKDPEKQGDCCYTFGGNTDVGEHCNVFLYYFPRLPDGDVFCN